MSTLTTDGYIPLNSLIHRWDPRLKLLGLVSLILSFAALSKISLIPVMLGITLCLYGLSQLPGSFWRQRLQYPGLFLVAVMGLLPLLSGEQILWQWGPIGIRQEGTLAALLIGSRFVCIFTLGLILLGTTPFLSLVKAMRSFRLPAILTDMLLLTYRYLADMGQDWEQMEQAMRLRGFHYYIRTHGPYRALTRWAAVIGTLLIRSYERSERVYQAMRLRGYGSHPQGFVWGDAANLSSWLGLGALLGISLGLITLQIL